MLWCMNIISSTTEASALVTLLTIILIHISCHIPKTTAQTSNQSLPFICTQLILFQQRDQIYALEHVCIQLREREQWNNQNRCYEHSWHWQRRAHKLLWFQCWELPLVQDTSGNIFILDTERESVCELHSNGTTSMAIL